MNRYQCSMVICGMVMNYTALGTTAPDERMLKHNLDKTVQHFKKSNAHTESSLEHMLGLLKAELTLVTYLQTGQTGMAVEDAVQDRERLLANSMPSLVYVYNVIMDFATHNPLLISPHTYLNYHERHAHLKRMHDTLEHYYHEFQTMQYRSSLAYQLQPHKTTY